VEYFNPMNEQREQRPIAEHRTPRARAGDRPTHPPVAAAVLVLSVLALLVLLAVASSI
jgi:hypothetical protein